MLIFHTAICAGASQIALMADGKPLSRISRRPVADAPEWGLICTKKHALLPDENGSVHDKSMSMEEFRNEGTRQLCVDMTGKLRILMSL